MGWVAGKLAGNSGGNWGTMSELAMRVGIELAGLRTAIIRTVISCCFFCVYVLFVVDESTTHGHRSIYCVGGIAGAPLRGSSLP